MSLYTGVPGQHKLAPKVCWDGGKEDPKLGESREVDMQRVRGVERRNVNRIHSMEFSKPKPFF